MKTEETLAAAKHIRECEAAKDKFTKSQLELDTFRCGGPQREEHETCYCDGCTAQRLDNMYGSSSIQIDGEEITLSKLAQLFKLWDMRGMHL